jgi:hypothetical protein
MLHFNNERKEQLRNAALDDLRSLQEDFNLEFDDLVKIRNPIAVARSERLSLLDAKTQKEIETLMNTKKSVVVKGVETRHHMMFEPQSAKQIAGAIDHLLSEYDEHRKVEILFDKIRTSVDERDNIRYE